MVFTKPKYSFFFEPLRLPKMRGESTNIMKGVIDMTKNQLQYWQNVETQRSNLARETETNRNNMAVESETHRANLAREVEAHRANVSNEIEMNRHHLATENLQLQNLLVTKQTASRQLDIAKLQAEEARRSNLAREQETKRSNIAREDEQKRSNQEQERLRQLESNRDYAVKKRAQSTASYDAETRRLAQGNTQRYQEASNILTAKGQAELIRSNKSKEAEIKRSNMAQEAISSHRNMISERQLHETARANRASEALRRFDTNVRLVTSLADTSVKAIEATSRLNSMFPRRVS